MDTTDPTNIYYGYGKVKPPHTIEKNVYFNEITDEVLPIHFGKNLPIKEQVTSTTRDVAEVVV